MENTMKMAIRKNLEAIEEVLNQHGEFQEEYYTYELLLRKNQILFYISDDDTDVEKYEVELNAENTDVDTIIKTMIKFLYDEEINHRSGFIKQTKNFNNRKIKSMNLWASRDNAAKVEQITKDLVERFNTNNKYKSEVDTYKSYVRDLYRALWELKPSWKVEQIKEQLEEKGFDDVKVKDNLTLIVNSRTYAIDSYTTARHISTEEEILKKWTAA